jgi:hypothetical protein
VLHHSGIEASATHPTPERALRLIAALFFLLLAVGSLRPISANDYPWHLATGRWIWEHRTLPEHDPFALASDDQKWINGEWLFQAALYPLQRPAGHEGISVVRALWAAGIFAAGFLFAARHLPRGFALLLATLCWYGALHRLDARPATVAVAFTPILIVLLRVRLRRVPRLVLIAAVAALWVNVHPSALLAPAVVALNRLPQVSARREAAKSVAETAAAFAGLLFNPHGFAAITAPLHLVQTIGSRTYINTEWLPSPLSIFPLLYITAAAGVVALVYRLDRKRDAGPLLVFLLLGFLAVRGVRNQDLFFGAVPFLLAPKLGTLTDNLRPRIQRMAIGAAAAIVLLATFGGRTSLGLDQTVFPVSAVRQLDHSGLKGNVYNPDQLGGYLAWSFYPERRHLIDGRHELFDDYLAEYAEARVDSRKWNALLRRYEVTLAVEEYRAERIEVTDAVSGQTRLMPASLVYFPRQEWALIGFDDVAMVFARRDAYPAEAIAALEYRQLLPDAPQMMAVLGEEEKREARRELLRAEKSGGSGVLWRMAAAVN